MMEHYFLEGSLLEMHERYQDAIREYSRALRFGTTSGAVHYAIAKCFRALGQDDSALVHAQESVRRDPRNIGAQLQYGELLLENGSFYPALEQFEKIIEHEPNNSEVRYMLARMWQHRDPERAIMHYEYIRQNLGDNFDALLNLSEIYLNNRRYNRAIDVIQQLLELGPVNPDIYRLLGDTYLRAERFDDAIALIDDASGRLATDSIVELYFIDQFELVGERLEQHYEAPSGLRSYVQALATRGPEILPESWRIRFYSGLALLHLDDSRRADSLIAFALRNRNVAADDWLAAANVYIDRKQYERVLSVLGPTAGRYSDTDVLLDIGIAFARTGRNDSAERYLRRSIDLDEGNAAAWAELGSMYLRQERFGAGLASYEKAIAYAPDNPQFQNDCAAILAERGLHLDRALALAREALYAEPENEEFLATMGWIYFRLDDFERALQYIQRSIAIGGAGPLVWEHLGDIQRARGDLASAREAYQRALKLVPGNSELQKKLNGVR
jgi:tetratricopeptide (TPR) repeat protein